MPIVVSYEDIDALGSAAIQGGYQPGLAEGQQSYRSRQQNDQQSQASAINSRWQMEREYQLRGQEEQRQRDFTAQRENVGRDFEAQKFSAEQQYRGEQAGLNRQNELAERLLQAQIQEQGRLQGQEHDVKMEQLRSADTLGRQAADDTRAQEAKRNEAQRLEDEAIFNARIANPNLSAGDARRWYASTQVAAQEAPMTRAARGAGTSGSPIGTYSGRSFQSGYLGVKQGGEYAAPLEVAEQMFKPDEKAAAIEETIQGAVTAISEMPVEQIVAELPKMPTPIKQRVIRMLEQRGEWSTGSNQRPGGQPGNGAVLAPPGMPKPAPMNGSDPERVEQESMRQELLRRGVPQHMLD